MWAYTFEHHVHYVCRECHDADGKYQYVHEIQTINQNYLTLLQQECYNSEQHVLALEHQQRVLDDTILEMQKEKQKNSIEISAYRRKMRKCSSQIAALTVRLEKGLFSQTQVQKQDKRRALRHLQGMVYAKLPPADERSLAWMMLSQSRLSSGTNCAAASLAGHDLVLDKIRHMCLVTSALDMQKQKCELLISIVRALAHMDPSLIIAKIDRAKNCQHQTAEQDVLGHLGVFEMEQNGQQTLRNVLFSTEFQERGLIERRKTPYARMSRSSRAEESESTRIEKYTADMIYYVQNFSKNLVSVALPSNASCLLCVVANEHYDDDDEQGEKLLAQITLGDALHTPLVSLRNNYASSTGAFYTISLYNLGSEDLSFSCDPIRHSAQLHEGDFLLRGEVDTDIPKHDNNIIPGRGFGFLSRFPCSRKGRLLEHHIRDVNNKVVLTFVL
jgi:hypothetical protein